MYMAAPNRQLLINKYNDDDDLLTH